MEPPREALDDLEVGHRATDHEPPRRRTPGRRMRRGSEPDYSLPGSGAIVPTAWNSKWNVKLEHGARIATVLAKTRPFCTYRPDGAIGLITEHWKCRLWVARLRFALAQRRVVIGTSSRVCK